MSLRPAQSRASPAAEDDQAAVSAGVGGGRVRPVYVIPLIVVVILAIVAVAWSPIFAVVIAAVAFVLFLGFAGMSRRADEKVGPPEARAAEQGRREEAETRIR
jgi:Flp pilus assembly protein TadB